MVSRLPVFFISQSPSGQILFKVGAGISPKGMKFSGNCGQVMCRSIYFTGKHLKEFFLMIFFSVS